MGRDLKHDECAGPGDAEELPDVTGGAGVRHMLEYDLAVDEVERPVREEAQIVYLVEDVLDPGAAPVELAGQVEHGGRDIDADDAREVIGQRLGEASDAAAEIEGHAAGEWIAGSEDPAEGRVYFRLPRAKEVLRGPLSSPFFGHAENGPERIFPGQSVPDVLETREIAFIHGYSRRLEFPALLRIRDPRRETQPAQRRADQLHNIS